MPDLNAEIADRFDELADLLEIEAANPFRVRAYRNASSLLRTLPKDVDEMLAKGADLTDLPGIGDDLAAKIREFVDSGHLKALDRIKREVPPHLADLLHVRGLGPKRVHAVYHELGIDSLEGLEKAARAGKLESLPGFGAKTQANVLSELAAMTRPARRRWADVEPVANELERDLAAIKGVRDVVVAGSFRRHLETVGDLDILVTARRDSPVMQRLGEHGEVAKVVSRGSTRSTVILRSGLQVDVRVVPQVSFGAALHYFTGSRAHNIAVRTLAVKQGLKINEYGVFRDGERIAGRKEDEVFASVGLPWIPPELREDRGEIQAAMKDELPRLVEPEDITGDLHVHSDWGEGQDSLEALAREAKARGHAYIAITDRGLDAARLREQMQAIDALDGRLEGIRLLKGAEVGIREDGSLALAEDLLARLDLCVCVIRDHFDLPAEKQTRRVLAALKHPLCTILAHPLGRLIPDRPAMALDMDQILRAAARHGAVLELNARPERLDLDDHHCRMAHELGARLCISSDARSAGELGLIRHGVYQARRGWIGGADVVNTLPLAELKKVLRKA
ncbi:MAG TPA: DNA polymerase/3'-5' exonuclease PolX [Chromatiales bacterium]|nr:DNA polymerase/3'-5' exonuclease PolX [Chromatiales bacterium]